MDEIVALKQEMLDVWDGPTDDSPPSGEAQFESLSGPRRLRGGLAIGHSIEPGTLRARLELRVTAKAGPNLRRAQKIEAMARARGFEAILRLSEQPRVIIQLIQNPRFPGRRRPLCLGASVSHQNAAAGTLGAFVRLRNGHHGIVSCGHVLARVSAAGGRSRVKGKWGAVDDPVAQPGWPDQDPVLAADCIARLFDFAPFIKSQMKNLDAAVAQLTDTVDIQGNTIPDHGCVPAEFRNKPIGLPLTTSELFPGMRVIKMGRTTGLTEATLSAVEFRNVRVEFAWGARRETFTFYDVHEVQWDPGWENDPSKWYSAPGDSGALVMSHEGLRPLGLHFTSTPVSGGRVSYVVPWKPIEDAFGVALI